MAKTEKIAIALPSDQIEAVERAVSEGRASTVHAYFSAAIDHVERAHAARTKETGAAAGAKKTTRSSSARRAPTDDQDVFSHQRARNADVRHN